MILNGLLYVKPKGAKILFMQYLSLSSLYCSKMDYQHSLIH